MAKISTTLGEAAEVKPAEENTEIESDKSNQVKESPSEQSELGAAVDPTESPAVVQQCIINTVANGDGCVCGLLLGNRIAVDMQIPMVELTV